MATIQELEGQLAKYQAKTPSLSQQREQLEQKAGLQNLISTREGIRRNIFDTEKLLRDTPSNVQSRARQLGGPVTQAVLGRLRSNAMTPLARQLQDFSRSEEIATGGITQASQDVGERLGTFLQDRMRTEQDFLRRIDAARQEQARRDDAALRVRLANIGNALGFAQLRAQQDQQKRLLDLLNSQGKGQVQGQGTPKQSARELGAITTRESAYQPSDLDRFAGLGKQFMDINPLRAGTEGFFNLIGQPEMAKQFQSQNIVNNLNSLLGINQPSRPVADELFTTTIIDPRTGRETVIAPKSRSIAGRRGGF